MAVFRYMLYQRSIKFELCNMLTKRFSRKYHNFESSLTSCRQLAKYKKDPLWHQNYRILDASWDLNEKDFKENYFLNRIPDSKFFDLEECRDKNSEYKMMLPSCSQFEDYVSECGISNDHHVVIYDNHEKHAIFSSPRLWWMFRVFGHDNVSIVNGGLKTWIQEGYDIISGKYSEEENLPKPPKRFKANFRPELVKDFEFIKENSKRVVPVPILECRGLATLPIEEGETDISNVSVPCATWSPFGMLLDPDKRSVRTADEIMQFFSSKNIDLDREVVTSCGRGVSASIVTFCIYYATGRNVPVYDGSWSEWKSRNS